MDFILFQIIEKLIFTSNLLLSQAQMIYKTYVDWLSPVHPIMLAHYADLQMNSISMQLMHSLTTANAFFFDT